MASVHSLWNEEPRRRRYGGVNGKDLDITQMWHFSGLVNLYVYVMRLLYARTSVFTPTCADWPATSPSHSDGPFMCLLAHRGKL